MDANINSANIFGCQLKGIFNICKVFTVDTVTIFMHYACRYFPDNAVVFEYMRDTLIEFARQVIIPIPHRIAKYVKIQLYFDDRWMMISEVRFESSKYM